MLVLSLILLSTNAVAGFDELWLARIAREPQETGVASIYADRTVATGERFDSTALTCAHKSRPLCSLSEARLGICPARSYVTVRFKGKAVECRINDRGPYRKGRVIDLSPATAKALGLTWEQGLGSVTLD